MKTMSARPRSKPRPSTRTPPTHRASTSKRPRSGRTIRVSGLTEEKRITQLLREQGFVPMDRAMKSRLIKSGNWGMPAE